MKWMLKNSAGKPDGVRTLTVLSFAVVSFNVLLAMFDSVTIGERTFNIREPDVALLTLYMGMTGTGYVMRRNKKDSKEGEPSDTE